MTLQNTSSADPDAIAAPVLPGQKKEDAEKGEGIDAAQGLPRRTRVRRLFIDPLVQDGLVRAKAVTVEAHQAFFDKLADRLGYLDDAMLVTLAEVVLRMAEGPGHNVWPAFATIWGHAIRLRRPPDDEQHIMTSWLVSVEGPIAREAGCLVELYVWLRRHGCPPSDWAKVKIREEAAENARERRRIARDIEAGGARPSDVDWLNRYLSTLSYCEALVARGEAKRAGVTE